MMSSPESPDTTDDSKDFNDDGSSNREFNRDGSPRNGNLSSNNGEEGKYKPPNITGDDVNSMEEVDSVIKSVVSSSSNADFISGDEIDSFITQIEKDLSANEIEEKDEEPQISSPTMASISSTKKKNHFSRDSLFDGSNDFDRHGFLIKAVGQEAFVLSNDDLKKVLVKEEERTNKWIYMLNDWDTFFLRKFKKVKSRVRKGIPHPVRGEAWYRLAHVEDMKTLFPLALDLSNLEERLNQKVIDEIERDVNRTFPSHRLYQEGGPGQEALRNVLQRYAILDPNIGYCQGMGFLAAMLLQYLHEHDAFFALVSLMNRPSLPFRGMYSPGMEDTKKVLAVFAILGEVKLPKLWAHLTEEGVHHSMYVTSWIMTVFISSFPFDFAVRVWDIIWLEGWKIVYKVAVGLLKYSEKDLLLCNMEEAMIYFRQLPERMNPDKVWAAIWSVKISQEEVNRCEQWYFEESS